MPAWKETLVAVRSSWLVSARLIVVDTPEDWRLTSASRGCTESSSLLLASVLHVRTFMLSEGSLRPFCEKICKNMLTKAALTVLVKVLQESEGLPRVMVMLSVVYSWRENEG